MKKSFFIFLAIVLYPFFLVAQIKDTLPSIQIENSKIEIDVNEKDNTVYKIAESNLEKEISLCGQDVIISGNDNKITIKGKVGKLSISGKNNEVDLETVKVIYISSDYNFVSWQASQNSTGKPIITDKGGYNNVGRKTENAIDKKDN